MAMDVDRFWWDGFLVLPNFFGAAEVMRWRRAALARGPTLADLLSDDALAEIVCDARIVAAAREILDGDPVYFGDSTAAIGYNGWGFHKDNSDRLDASAPDWQTDRYPLIRFGIYPQSHDPEPGGLELRRGSHMIADYTSGEYLSPRVQPGDVIVWNFRTSHSAGVRKLKWPNIRVPHNKWVGRLNQRVSLEWAMRQQPVERVGLFLTLAREGPLLDRHIEYLKQRAYPWDIWAQSDWSPMVRQKTVAAGLKLIDPTSLKYDGRPVHVDYHPLAR